MIAGKKSIHYTKKQLPDQNSVNLSYRNIKFAHQASVGETLISLSSLVVPSSGLPLGFVQPSDSTLASINLMDRRNNIRLVSSVHGYLEFDQYSVVSANTLILGTAAVAGERFMCTIEYNVSGVSQIIEPLPQPTGMGAPLFGKTAPQGWLLADGRTIGSSASGATSIAGVEAYNLYVHLWNDYENTELVIQTSTGTPTTRGTSAEDDWNANKRMPLPDSRGRVLAGVDDGANRITNAISGVNGNTLGASGGDQRSQQHDHTINHGHTASSAGATATWTAGSTATTGFAGAHSHTIRNVPAGFAGTNSGRAAIDNGNDSPIVDSGWLNADGEHQHNNILKSQWNSNQTAHSHTITVNSHSGSSEPSGAGSSQNVQPSLIVNFIIKL